MGKIITQRTAQDDHHALLIAQGMTNAGADVFAVTNDKYGYVQVYCKHADSLSTEKIDREISRSVSARAEHYQAV